MHARSSYSGSPKLQDIANYPFSWALVMRWLLVANLPVRVPPCRGLLLASSPVPSGEMAARNSAWMAAKLSSSVFAVHAHAGTGVAEAPRAAACKQIVYNRAVQASLI